MDSFSMYSGLYQVQTVFLFLRELSRRVRRSWFQQELTLPSEEGQFWFQEEVEASTSRRRPQSESTSMVLYLFDMFPFEHAGQPDGVKSIPPRKSALSLPQTATFRVLFKDSDFFNSKKCYIFTLKWFAAQEFAGISAVSACGQNNSTLILFF